MLKFKAACMLGILWTLEACAGTQAEKAEPIVPGLSEVPNSGGTALVLGCHDIFS